MPKENRSKAQKHHIQFYPLSTSIEIMNTIMAVPSLTKLPAVTGYIGIIICACGWSETISNNLDILIRAQQHHFPSDILTEGNIRS